MGSVIDSDLLLRAAYHVTLAALGSTLLLIGTIAWLRIARRLHERRIAKLNDRWQPLLAHCALAPPVELPQVTPRQRQAFFALWNHYYGLLRGDSHHHLRLLASAPHLRHYVNRTLRWGGLRQRIIAATTAGHLGDPSAVPALKSLVSHQSPTLALAAAKSLIEIDAAEHLPWLLPLIAQRVDWPIANLAITLRNVDAETFGKALARAVLDAASRPSESRRLPRLLRLTEIARREHMMPAIRTLLERGETLNIEVLTACLRLIIDPREAPWVRQFLVHREWFVRVCAANALRRVGGSEDREPLIALLKDAHWWVRYRAAQALTALPGVGPADIDQLCRRLEDPYARDMLAHVAAENRLQ